MKDELQILDQYLWESLKKTIIPISHNICKKYIVKKPIKIYNNDKMSFVLDLHEHTVQNAYNVLLKFIENHSKNKSRFVTIITGYGTNNQGIIKNEIEEWFKTKPFAPFIKKYNWMNDGSIKLWLN